MKQDHPRISFAYPTFLRAGLLANGPFIPETGMQVSEFPSKLSFYVTAGLILNTLRSYSFDVDVIFDGKSLIPVNRPAVDSKLLSPAVSERGDFTSTSMTLISAIDVPDEGLYTIKVLLYTGGATDSDRELLDQHECHFVLAKNWLPTEMSKME